MKAGPPAALRRTVALRPEETARVRAFLIAPVRAYREPLARALDRAGVEVVGTARDPASALPCIGELEPDVVVLEAITLEQRWSVAGLRAAAPETPIVGLGVSDAPADAVGLVEAGASGYVTTDQSVEEAASVLRSVVDGEFPCSGRVAAILASRVAERSAAGRPAAEPATAHLTARELEIAELIGAGLSNKEIAQMLSIELSTVKNHVHHLLAKLGVTRRAEVSSRIPPPLTPWGAPPDRSAPLRRSG